MIEQTWQSTFEQVYDVAVVGGGYAGFAAAVALRRAGQRVLLIDARGDLLWESGRALAAEAGDTSLEPWRDLLDDLTKRRGAATGADGTTIDGAIAEVVATDRLRRESIAALYYAQPLAVRCEGPCVTSLIVATKAGARRVIARQWIDATEHGLLLRLIDRNRPRRRPTSQWMYGYLQHTNWASEAKRCDALSATVWPEERRYAVAVPVDADAPAARAHLIEVLLAAPPFVRDAVMSHCSVEPYPQYDAGGDADTPDVADHGNVACAAAALVGSAVRTLADRYMLGHRAAERLVVLPVAEVSTAAMHKPIGPIEPVERLTCDVCVAGAGTGGAVAAIAAGRQNVRTLCFDAMPFAGGIGSGGGIHSYYYGVAGGLQSEIDRAVRHLMQDSDRLLSGGPFNPEAKKIVLERLIRDAGVTFRTGVMLYGVERDGERVTRLLAAGPDGPITIEADAWIDCTGDGDVCAMAGTPFTFGRAGDGLPHAYSQSSGALREHHNRITMGIINFDAGWCDPTDSEDLTRARLEGIGHYLMPRYETFRRPTYIAPAIGLRQSRQIITDRVLQMDDLIASRRFDDVIGYTGCHYDNHAVDYEHESDEALFWIWLSRTWRMPMGCELSYRMLLPHGLDNVWIAGRSLGVSQDAHAPVRMQRDMQRIGEAAALAAALCVKAGVTSRQVDYAALRTLLEQSGALKLSSEQPLFNPQGDLDVLDAGRTELTAEAALAALDQGQAGRSLWWLYRHRDMVHDAVKQRIGHDNPWISWLAAGLCAMWGDADAQPRLIHAIVTREYGYDETTDQLDSFKHLRNHEQARPEGNRRLAPNWLVAVSLLRCCGTAVCVPALANLAANASLPLNGRTGIAHTLARLADRGAITAADAEPVLDQLTATQAPGSSGAPQRAVGRMAVLAWSDPAGLDAETRHNPHGYWAADATICLDYTWQLHLAVARARVALGLAIHPQGLALRHHPQGLVRHAIEAIATRTSSPVTAGSSA